MPLDCGVADASLLGCDPGHDGVDVAAATGPGGLAATAAAGGTTHVAPSMSLKDNGDVQNTVAACDWAIWDRTASMSSPWTLAMTRSRADAGSAPGDEASSRMAE
jgi:hypothetical protein